MKKEKYEQQRDTAHKNEYRILNALSMGSMTFTELQRTSGLTPAGLTKVLQRLQMREKIYRKEEGKKVIYSISRGMTVKELVYLGDTIERLRSEGAKYYIDFSDNMQSDLTKYSLAPYGILSHLFLDKEIGKEYNLFSKKDIFLLEMSLFEKIKSNVEEIQIILNRKLIDVKDKKIILAFEIDYAELSKAIKSFSEKDHKKLLKTRLRELER